ncbi:hypothetical protein FHS43_004697 [Streptosporangium becharense]|uniref:Uncharacterized protein n=1 Tax=Streptosporangium becharense TaxID=1816182 RepID=A0A7W9MI34_9ACTN|nr:hypothetical protein [Streptosporangium becharense]MBB5821083.1 hypothetical protein [Streptosporangium becharense]
MSPMVAGVLVALMLICCVGYELCLVPGRDRHDIIEGD